MPDGALFSVANAAVYGMVQALQAEFRDRPQRINEVRSCGVGGWQRLCLAAALHSLQCVDSTTLPAAAAHTHPHPGLPRPALQLRIGAIVRRDSEKEHPSFPGEGPCLAALGKACRSARCAALLSLLPFPLPLPELRC
jgi:hypothetical protein